MPSPSDFLDNDHTILSSHPIWKCSHKDKICIDLVEKNKSKTHYFNKMKAVNLKGYKYFLIFPNEIEKINLLLPEGCEQCSSISHNKISESEYRKLCKQYSFRTFGRPSSCYLFSIAGERAGVISIRKNKNKVEIVNMFNTGNKDCRKCMLEVLTREIKSDYVYYLDRRIESPDLFLKLGFVIKDMCPPRWYLFENEKIKRNTNKYVGDKIWDCGYIKMELTPSP